MSKILLVDDHKMVRDGIKFHLEEHDRFEVVGEATNGREGLDLLATKTVDLVLTDIMMPGMNGIDFTREAMRQYPDLKVLALTMLIEPQYVRQMMAAGAAGYLLKTGDEAEIIAALDAALAGQTYYSREVTNTVMEQLTGRKKFPGKSANPTPLSERELEVLRLIVKEYSNQEIAKELFISPRTVDAHKRNLLEKTGSKNLAGLVVYALSHQLFDEL